MQNYKLQKHKTFDIQAFITKYTKIKPKKGLSKLVYFASLFIALKKQRVLRQFFHTNTLTTQGLFFLCFTPPLLSVYFPAPKVIPAHTPTNPKPTLANT